MKYAIIDMTNPDWFEDVFDSKAKAVSAADYEWGIMSKADKNRRVEYFVASCELDEDGCVIFESIKEINRYK